MIKDIKIFCFIFIAALVLLLVPYAFSDEIAFYKTELNEISYSAYVVDGIMYSKTNPRVMIGGEIFEVNEIIDGAKIVSIEVDRIKIKLDDFEQIYEIGDLIIKETGAGIFIKAEADVKKALLEVIEKEKQSKENIPQQSRERMRPPQKAQKTLTGDGTDYLGFGQEVVRIDVYNPGYGNRPAVILIHGATGIGGDRAVRYEKFATDLRTSGIIAINVHYFNSTRENWLLSIKHAITYAQEIPNSNRNKIGLIGYSLGGGLALKVASLDDRVKLLAVVAGSLPGGFSRQDARRLPKTLMICGDQDPAFSSLNTLKTWFTEMGKPIETKIDKGIGHDNIPMDVFNEDWERVVEFCKKGF